MTKLELSRKANVLHDTTLALQQAVLYGGFTIEAYEWVFTGICDLANDISTGIENLNNKKEQ